MKAKLTSNLPEFQPIVIQLTIETEKELEELRTAYMLFDQGNDVDKYEDEKEYCRVKDLLSSVINSLYV